MKINIPILSIISGFILFSCAPDIAYQDLSNFNIQANAIPNNTKLLMMYSSASPKEEKDLSYFIHLVGVVKNGTDTVNVLTTFNRGDGGGSAKNVFKYYTLDSKEGLEYFENLYKDGSKSESKLSEISDITRVTYDKRFDYIAKNSYPTVIGFIEK
jgi:hypothetical protein